MSHTCHAEGCNRQCPEKFFMCPADWAQLPKKMRDAICAEYKPGQEIRKDPTPAYLRVAREAIDWLAEKQGKRDF